MFSKRYKTQWGMPAVHNAVGKFEIIRDPSFSKIHPKEITILKFYSILYNTDCL